MARKDWFPIDKTPSHDELVRGLETNRYLVEVDSEKASELATEGILGSTLRLNAYVWGCGWVGCILLAPLLVVLHSWWWLFLVPAGAILPQGLRWMNYWAILNQLKESEEFYQRSLEHDVITDIRETD